MTGTKRGRKAMPIAVDVMGARENRIILRFPDATTRDIEMENLRLAGELDDGIEWKSFHDAAVSFFDEIESDSVPIHTIQSHRRYYERFLEERFQGRSVRAATASEIAALRRHVMETSAPTVWTRVNWTLKAIVKLAVSEGHIPLADDPYKRLNLRTPDETALVLRQRAKAKQFPLPTLDDCHRLLRRSIDAQDWLRVALHLMLLAGLRSGEVRALKWGHISFERDEGVVWIHVQKAVTRGGELGTPKSNAGTRDIPVKGALFDLLDGMDPGLPGVDAYVVQDGEVLAREAIYNALQKFEVSIGIGRVERVAGRLRYPGTYHPHLLRHAAVAWWIWRGVPEGLIMEWIGHARLQTTLDTYGYIIEARRGGDTAWPSGKVPDGAAEPKKGKSE